MKSGNLNFLETSGPLQACNGTDLLLCISKRKLTSSLLVMRIPACCQHCMFLVKTCFHILFRVVLVLCLMICWKEKIAFFIRYFRIPSSKRALTCRQKTVPFDTLWHSPTVYSRDAQDASTNRQSFSPWLSVYTRHCRVSLSLIVRWLVLSRFSEFALQFRHSLLSVRK